MYIFKSVLTNRVCAYIMIDSQNNRTLPSSQLFDLLGNKDHNVEYIQNVEYIRVPISCAGKERAAGRQRKMT